MRGRRYTAPPLTSTCSVVCQSYKKIITEGKKIRKRKSVCGFHNPIGAFRRKADYKYETDMMERLDNELVFITSDADKMMRCYHFMHLLGDIAAYNEKGFTIQSEAIEKIFPDYIGYIDFLKSKDQTVDVNYLVILQYNLEKDIS